jgi:hypothetical protein
MHVLDMAGKELPLYTVSGGNGLESVRIGWVITLVGQNKILTVLVVNGNAVPFACPLTKVY